MHSPNLSRTTDFAQLARLPGVSTLAYGRSGWTLSTAGEEESPAILLTNVEDVAKAVHKRLQREQVNHGPDLYYEEDISSFLGAVVTGCRDALKKHRMVWSPNETASSPNRAPK